MEATQPTIEAERISFVRERIQTVEDDDLLANPTGQCPNSKSAINIAEVVTYQPKPIEVAITTNLTKEDPASLHKTGSNAHENALNDADEDEASDEDSDQPGGLPFPIYGFAEKYALTAKIGRLAPEKLAGLVDIIQKFEKLPNAGDVEIDLETVGQYTLYALEQYVNGGIVPEPEDEVDDLLSEDNAIIQDARKILETGSRRQVKRPEKYNPLEQIRQEVNLYRKKTLDKLVEKKKDENFAKLSEGNTPSVPREDIALDATEWEAIQKEVEDKVKAFLKENDAEKDMEWFKSQFVVQSVKDDYCKGIEQALQHVKENLFLEDAALLNTMIEDDVLIIENPNVYKAVLDVIHLIYTARGRQRLEGNELLFEYLVLMPLADPHGSFYSVEYQETLLAKLMAEMERIIQFAQTMRNDDTVDCVSYQSSLEDMFEALLTEIDALFQRRIRALQREELEIAYHIQKNNIEKKSVEYHILYHVVQFYVTLEDQINETMELISDWYDNLFGGSDEEASDDEEDEEEETWDQLEARAKRADEAAAKKKAMLAKRKKFKDDSEEEDEEDDNLSFESEEEEELPKIKFKYPLANTPPAKKTPPSKSGAKKSSAKKPAVKKTPIESDEDPLDDEGETSTKTPVKKSTKKNIPVDSDSVYEFKTLNVFIRDLQKTYLIPQQHYLTGLAQEDLKLIVTRSDESKPLPQGLKSVDVRAQPHDISIVFKIGAKDQMTLQQLAHFTELYQKVTPVKPPFAQQYLEDTLNYYCYLMPLNRALLHVFIYVYLPFYCNVGLKAEGVADLPYLENKFLQSDTLTLISLDTPIMTLLKDAPKMETPPVVSLDRQVIDLVTSYYQAIYKKHPRVWEMQRDPQQKLKATPLPKKDKAKIDRFYSNKPTSGTPKGANKNKASPVKSETSVHN